MILSVFKVNQKKKSFAISRLIIKSIVDYEKSFDFTVLKRYNKKIYGRIDKPPNFFIKNPFSDSRFKTAVM